MSLQLAASSALIMIGVIPAKLHSPSLDVVRYDLAIIRFMSLFTLVYVRLFYSHLRASIQTGAPYSKIVMIEHF